MQETECGGEGGGGAGREDEGTRLHGVRELSVWVLGEVL